MGEKQNVQATFQKVSAAMAWGFFKAWITSKPIKVNVIGATITYSYAVSGDVK